MSKGLAQLPLTTMLFTYEMHGLPCYEPPAPYRNRAWPPKKKGKKNAKNRKRKRR